MSVAKYLCHTEIPSEPSDPFSKHVLRVFRALAAEKRGGQFQETDNNNCTILHYVAACRTNFPFQEVTELALENQADPGMTDVDGEFPLTRAAYGSQDNVEFMRLLIPHMQRTQLEQSIYSGDTMLHYIYKTKRQGRKSSLLIYSCRTLRSVRKGMVKVEHFSATHQGLFQMKQLPPDLSKWLVTMPIPAMTRGETASIGPAKWVRRRWFRLCWMLALTLMLLWVQDLNKAPQKILHC